MLRGRSSGVLLHPTSLPGGRLGDEAYRFVDWLAAAGQSWWQVLPLGPPNEHGSPYRARSAFAAWTGLLAEPGAPVSTDEVEDFVARHPYWAGDWASFDGRGAIAGQVRFEREWSALRRYAAGKGVRVLQMASPQMCLRQGEATEHLLAAHVLCRNLFQRLREQRHGVGDAPG